MTVLNVVPNPRDRESKERHRTTVSADHKGKYLALCKTDLNNVGIMLYMTGFTGNTNRKVTVRQQHFKRAGHF
jgi:hypothetical protein